MQFKKNTTLPEHLRLNIQQIKTLLILDAKNSRKRAIQMYYDYDRSVVYVLNTSKRNLTITNYFTARKKFAKEFNEYAEYIILIDIFGNTGNLKDLTKRWDDLFYFYMSEWKRQEKERHTGVTCKDCFVSIENEEIRKIYKNQNIETMEVLS